MTAQSVKTQPMDFSRGTARHKVKGLSSSSGFDQVMDSSMKTKVNDSNKLTTSRNTVKAKVKEAVGAVIKEQSKVNPNINSETVAKGEELGLVDNGTLEKDILVDNTDDESLITEDVLLEILGSIQQAIMNVLNIDMEELAKAMEDLGIVNVDLLNPDTLRQLVLMTNGKSEAIAFLTDENLVRSVNELMENVDTILSHAGIDLSEDELKAFAEKLHNIMTANKQDLDNIPHNNQQLEEDFNSSSATSMDSQAPDASLDQDVISNNASVLDNTADKTMRQEVKTEHTSKTEMDNKLADTVESKASNVVETRELEFSQTDQDDNNSNDMNSKNQFDGFIDQMINVTQKTQQVDFIGNEMQITEFREIANQIIEQIKVTVLQDQTSIELQLNPENLGKVNLSLQSKDGVLTAQFVVNNDRVREAIESQMVVLKDNLEQQGLKVDTIEVTVANYTFDGRHESNSSGASKEEQHTRRGISLEEAISMSELSQDEEEIGILNSELGNRIDYTA